MALSRLLAMYSWTRCTCQRKFGTRVTRPSAATGLPFDVLVKLSGRLGGSPDGWLGLSVGKQGRLCGGSPVSSLGRCCPSSWSEGLPAGPHGHCVPGSFSRPPGLPSSSLSSSSPPPSPAACLLRHWLPHVPPYSPVHLPRHWLPLSHVPPHSPAHLEVALLVLELSALWRKLLQRHIVCVFSTLLPFFLARIFRCSAHAL